MRLHTKELDGVWVVTIQGKVGSWSNLREPVLKGIEKGFKDIVFDLAGVSTIDSSGVGELVAAYTTAANRGAHLRLAHLPQKVDDILHITQLITVFDVHDSVGEAVAATKAH